MLPVQQLCSAYHLPCQLVLPDRAAGAQDLSYTVLAKKQRLSLLTSVTAFIAPGMMTALVRLLLSCISWACCVVCSIEHLPAHNHPHWLLLSVKPP